MSGFVRYTYAPSGQDAIVPVETRQAASYVLAYDNTNGVATGVAVANNSSSSVALPPAPSRRPTILVTVYDSTGAQLATDSLLLPAHGQMAYTLTGRVAPTANTRGSVHFTTPAGGSISVLGLRFPTSGSFTTIPIVTP